MEGFPASVVCAWQHRRDALPAPDCTCSVGGATEYGGGSLSGIICTPDQTMTSSRGSKNSQMRSLNSCRRSVSEADEALDA